MASFNYGYELALMLDGLFEQSTENCISSRVIICTRAFLCLLKP